MEITQTFHAPDRRVWRKWLMEHYRTEKEIWLITYRKRAGKMGISYSDAVEEALCFGWIDSTVKSLDAERTAQRFSPRKPGSPYSQTNKERLRRLLAQGQVAEDVRATLGDSLEEEFKIPPDILQALKANEQAWSNFRRYPEPYQRIRIAYIDGARKRPEEFQKRLKHFLHMTEQNKQFGYGIETFY
jgi:uncharacterized protein YdeI (YjbR/CyaY-like superfamily)